MPKSTPYTPLLLAVAGMCFSRGWGYKRTAAHIGVPVYTVRDWFRIWRNRGDMPPGDLPEAVQLHPAGLRGRVREARRQGKSYAELEGLFGVPKATVRFWCQNLGTCGGGN